MEKAIIHKIVVSTSRQNKGNRLLKIKCPFCGKEHTHGGGVEGEDVRLYGGSRVSHCWKGAGIGNMYELVFPDEISFAYKRF